MTFMKLFFKKFKNKKEVEDKYDYCEIRQFYIQLLKMKKKRPHINVIDLLYKCYPNAKKNIKKIIVEHEN